MAYGYGKHVQKPFYLNAFEYRSLLFGLSFVGAHIPEMGRTFNVYAWLCVYVCVVCMHMYLCTRKCFANVTDANCNTETFQLNSQQNNTKHNNDFDGKIDFFFVNPRHVETSIGKLPKFYRHGRWRNAIKIWPIETHTHTQKRKKNKMWNFKVPKPNKR